MSNSHDQPNGAGGGYAEDLRNDPSRRSMVSEALKIQNFPAPIQGLLSDAFDDDGDGHIATEELVVAANNHIKTREKNTMLWKGLAAAVVIVFILVGCNAGLTAGIVKANKDTQVEGRNLMNKAEEPVSVGTNEVAMTLGAIPFIPIESASHVESLAFMSEDGETVYHRKTRSIDVQKDKGMKLRTTDGDTVEWSADGGKDLTVTLEDGTTWSMCMFCSECTAINVYSTPEVLEGLERFEEFTETQRRRRRLDSFVLGGQGSRGLQRIKKTDGTCGVLCE